ncbi:glycosyltransferase family 1 protein [Agrococcus sediminis]|uniref:Glycosyltransferase family 1 protein n=1 Tax=Agrococcus sediminis TaxID=2599924 RepID=A0A5M8QI36_9MICO|nr:glycosyltransferase [Agrococcus sediminis]KAA6434888.1 glycosyltransferase family 1 protein [Agrococcus sediminis]
MAHLLVTAMPFAGHVRPMTAVAAALLARGHRVTAYTGDRHVEAFDRLGCETLVWRDALDFDEHRLAEAFPGVAPPGPLGTLANLGELFIGTAPGQVGDIRAAHERTPFDALVGDVMAVGTGLAAEVLGLPWASVSLMPLTMRSRDLPPPGLAMQPARTWLGRARDRMLRAVVRNASGPLDRSLRAARAELGLGPGRPFDEALYSPKLVLATGSPSLEYDPGDLPASVRFVGWLEPRTGPLAPPPLWAETLADEPRQVVFVTQGTVDTDPSALLLPTIEALAHVPVRVIGTTAGHSIEREVPANARLVDFVPYSAVVPHTDVGVTNGGWGGVLEMLACGVPLVVAGGSADKPEVAARVAWSGAGIDLRTGRPRPPRVLAAVRKVLREPRYRTRARQIADELSALGGASRAAELVECLLVPTPPCD